MTFVRHRVQCRTQETSATYYWDYWEVPRRRVRAPMTLLEKYGLVRSTRVIQDFYEDVLKDPLLASLFARVTIPDLATHQVDVLVMVMGGRDSHTPRQIRHSHARLRISDAQFDAMLNHLRLRLISNDFEPRDADQIVASYRKYHGAVTGRHTPRDH